MLALVGDDCLGLMYDTASETEIAKLRGHLDFCFAVAWHPDGQSFVTGSQVTPLLALYLNTYGYLIIAQTGPRLQRRHHEKSAKNRQYKIQGCRSELFKVPEIQGLCRS